MTDRHERLEVAAWLLFAVSLGAMEGGVVSVMVRTFYRNTVDALTLDYSVAVLVGAPVFGSIASLAWAAAGWRQPSRLLVGLQMLCAVCLLLLAAAPRNAIGLAMVVTGAVSGRLLWSGVLTCAPRCGGCATTASGAPSWRAGWSRSTTSRSPPPAP